MQFTKKLLAEIVFPKPSDVEEGGDELVVSLNTSEDCSRNENYSHEAWQSERLRSISTHKTAEEKKY